MSMEQEWQRLQDLYAAMSDGELLRLAESKAGLTEVAQQAIDAEMSRRGLEVPVEEPKAVEAEAEDMEVPADPSVIELITFNVPMDAETAMRLLDEHDVPAHMEHAVRQVNEDGPKVKMNWLSIFVERTRKEDAMAVLRKGMGLFPVLAPEEMDGEDEEGDEEEILSIVGDFELAADAEIAKKALTDAGIWFQADMEPGVEGVMIEVRFSDFERAMEVVETAFDEAEQ
jgi:hypothetical protein